MPFFSKWSPTAKASVISSLVGALSSVAVAYIGKGSNSGTSSYHFTVGEHSSVVTNFASANTSAVVQSDSRERGRSPVSNDQVLRDQVADISNRLLKIEGSLEIIKPLLLRKGDTATITAPPGRVAEILEMFSSEQFDKLVPSSRAPASVSGASEATTITVTRK